MKTCNNCSTTFVATDSNAVKCPHCSLPLQFVCRKCGALEPARFTKADVCEKEATKIHDTFYKKYRNFKPLSIMVVAGVIMLLSTFVRLFILFIVGILLFAGGLLYQEATKQILHRMFKKLHPTLAELFIDEE